MSINEVRTIIIWQRFSLWLIKIFLGKKFEQKKREELLNPLYTKQLGKRLLTSGLFLLFIDIIYFMSKF
jgi:hypothetical protein